MADVEQRQRTQTDYERGLSAERVMKEVAYKEAWKHLEGVWISMLADPETTHEKATEIRRYLVAGRKLRQYLERVMGEGNLAAAEIRREESRKGWRERFRSVV